MMKILSSSARARILKYFQLLGFSWSSSCCARRFAEKLKLSISIRAKNLYRVFIIVFLFPPVIRRNNAIDPFYRAEANCETLFLKERSKGFTVEQFI